MREVTAIFDVGKTNKKLLLFDSVGKVLRETQYHLATTADEDGFPCEDIDELTRWIKSEWRKLLTSEEYKVVAVNFAAYGASFVHVGNNGKPIAPLYDYMKPIPKKILNRFYKSVRNQFRQNINQFTQTTCSPSLGMLNAGVQLYWLKKSKRKLWDNIKFSLHLPQYLSYIISAEEVSDYTSIGCHTALWDFRKFQYAPWVSGDILSKLAPLTTKRHKVIQANNGKASIKVGFGLHDSSSALIPYVSGSHSSFMLISTGTWSIQLNPFNTSNLTLAQLHKDCLCYMQPDGKQVKASRLLLGREHDYQIKRIAEHFNISQDFYKEMEFDEAVFGKVQTINRNKFYPACMQGTGPLPKPQTCTWNISIFQNQKEAYHSLIAHLVTLLMISIQLIDVPRVKTLFVDGGFARNTIFMNVLAYYLYQKKVVASYLPQSTALGAFLHLHGMKGIKSEDFDSHFKIYGHQQQIS
ncbi:MAG: carbohydrate kinase [Cyclobacteriaceae bacterium]|nr:carbohydrate kinase [Cyclobacteriaceae bacterium]